MSLRQVQTYESFFQLGTFEGALFQRLQNKVDNSTDEHITAFEDGGIENLKSTSE